MKIATFNINNVNKRLANLLDWLRTARPDVACLQELKATDSEFPVAAIGKAGYGAIWRGQKSWNGVAILARDGEPIVTHTVLPGDLADTQSRYIEAAVNGVLIATLYAPNGNPQPGPKFKNKLAWMRRLTNHAAELYALDLQCRAYRRGYLPYEVLRKTRFCSRRAAPCFGAFSTKAGWTPSERAPMYTFWDYKRNRWQRDAGLRIDHVLLNPKAAERAS